ncbi:hypothetical protein MSUIS_04080 [Mycoplasma suis KI3806]|uniref:Uncharacterized protein n=1 Tax=Mycoplasma suis (strain KI_3806) TaxID=708248 RepID=F0V1H0_MYCS3|nr:hypothetical protein [Mycoplasma suis]CBZ40501.1 hypothetical protein MSUIS_04080 [Mycoplasma suis KI3806]
MGGHCCPVDCELVLLPEAPLLLAPVWFFWHSSFFPSSSIFLTSGNQTTALKVPSPAAPIVLGKNTFQRKLIVLLSY